jgi:hypothetical protein
MMPRTPLLLLLAGVAAACGAWPGATPARAATPEALYGRECGACHMAYPPQLLPARSWRALMAGLDRHFGENAALDPGTAKSIAGYLAAKAAGVAGWGGPVLEGLGPEDVPLRITDTPFWKYRHAEIDPARFSSPTVKSKSNCLACHGKQGGDD